MERITSRKNRIITHFRALGSDRAYRRETGLFLCDGEKLLRDALDSGAEVRELLLAEGREPPPCETRTSVYVCPPELLSYVSPLKNSPGPLFTVELPQEHGSDPVSSAIVLERVQDPGNVGTVLRTANALGIDAVALLPGCADPWGPKAVRSSMGAVFRQRVLETNLENLSLFLEENNLELWGAALSPEARDIRELKKSSTALAIGSEGSGLSRDIKKLCRGLVMIPMEPGSESLNAAVAAAIGMWELRRARENVNY